jgi:transcriptional regulator with XRE-family HTH domain
MSSENKEIIKKIKIYMVEHELDQTKLAEQLNVSQQYVSMVLTGREKITNKFLDIIQEGK